MRVCPGVCVCPEGCALERVCVQGVCTHTPDPEADTPPDQRQTLLPDLEAHPYTQRHTPVNRMTDRQV